MTSDLTPPAGWYPDKRLDAPAGQQRYWDGLNWTEHTTATAPTVGPVPPQAPPSNNMVWAIISTVLCCLPAGIVAIVYAAKVNTLWAAGQYQEAIKAAAQARTWAIASAVVGVVVGVVYFASGLSGY